MAETSTKHPIRIWQKLECENHFPLTLPVYLPEQDDEMKRNIAIVTYKIVFVCCYLVLVLKL